MYFNILDGSSWRDSCGCTWVIVASNSQTPFNCSARLKKYQRTIMLRKKLVEIHTCRRYARHATACQQSLDLALQDKQIVLIISPTISYLSHIPVTKHIEAIEDDFIGENWNNNSKAYGMCNCLLLARRLLHVYKEKMQMILHAAWPGIMKPSNCQNRAVNTRQSAQYVSSFTRVVWSCYGSHLPD